MPAPNLDQVVAASWNKLVTDKPEDNIFNDRPFFVEMTTKNGGLKKLDGGAKIEGTIEYATNTTFRSYTDYEVLDVQKIDVFSAAEYEWKEHSGTVTYSLTQRDVNMGDSQKFDLIAGLLENAKESHKENLNTAIHGAQSGNNILGLQDIIATSPSSGTVGGINRLTFSFWRNQAASGAKTSSNFDNLRARMITMFHDCSEGSGGSAPTFILSAQTPFEGYESLLTPNERFTSKDEGNASFMSLKFRSARMYYDVAAQSATMRFINPKYLHLCVHKNAWMKMEEPQSPVNQNIVVRKIRTLAQLVSFQPRRLGVLHSIS